MKNNFSNDRILNLFEKVAAIPHGSGNMTDISNFIVNFAKENNLRYIKDDAQNVIVYKDATEGYENAEPVILQGHLDMVCQKTADSNFDFEKDGLELYIDGDFLKAKNTTLGADNGIAVAMILSVLERDDISHPQIEAVFTTDEEIGMIGASKLDFSCLKSKKMINLDSEEDHVITVSCAGGSDFKAYLPISYENVKGTKIEVTLKGLLGGHSGVEIDKGRINANRLAGRLLTSLSEVAEFDIVSINGGDKANAIPNLCKIEICTENKEKLTEICQNYLSEIKNEISSRESGFDWCVETGDFGNYNVFSKQLKNDVIYALTVSPNGILQMSAEIENLVETSLNLGILKTCEGKIFFHYALRSNKASALKFLDKKMELFFSKINCETESCGYYPPWEYKNDSTLRDVYLSAYIEKFGKEPKIEAIHAGLECSVFASRIKDLDCIAVGPTVYDVHTVNERMSISSTHNIYELLIDVLRKSL